MKFGAPCDRLHGEPGPASLQIEAYGKSNNDVDGSGCCKRRINCPLDLGVSPQIQVLQRSAYFDFLKSGKCVDGVSNKLRMRAQHGLQIETILTFRQPEL